MKKIIKSAVKKYFKYAKRSEYKNAEQCAERLGYNVVFFNTPQGDEMLAQCECVEFAKTRKAFTYSGAVRVIFIDNRLSPEDKFYVLLHEIGHILMGHVGDGKAYSRNSIVMDIETNAFVNAVLEHKKINVLSVLSAAVILMVGMAMGVLIPVDWNAQTIVAPASTSNEVYENTSDNQSEIVYVTHAGTKFHRADCRYTKDKDCIAMSRAEAVQSYAPCKVCKP